MTGVQTCALPISDIYVASSLREGFGINLLEAMHCGLPVVATKNRGHKTLIKHNINGYITESNSAEEIAFYIEKLCDDPKLIKEISKIDVSEYDADCISRKLFKIIISSTLNCMG